ncbi:bifunctional DNA-binding transcriptional regulator/O6-methylguanine-DNA methyltransferase Ada [Sphingomonas sp. MA1305]|uniref:bifunctional DNA-binding transcriptional regulator/O6-methylguanine-DNA methyltransferase Ada n=1 Tax=Sphingomonas sp. MA1305 TaxID=2479204 RepID=UPI0018DF2036|nr:bifunctional DNA-binding transcriptional regulator/O6-methylguanine-DNA methyltransferase Ada [Sphingomonas sp. MA1305]MBI0476797.1 bifunctional DNA-binding transcriptional regulator/O6-methylguanine-DNA methyltransferase Ada [Sphingomonas sp. MA1305]
MTEPIDPDAAWAAFLARDRRADGRFVVAVHSTGIYCRASCPARRPARDRVSIFADPAGARAAGYRACRRCTPDSVARDTAAVAEAARRIEESADAIPLADLAAGVGYSPHHFQRLFTRATGVSPAAYARALRAARAADHLQQEPSVTHALYEAGYAAPSRFYADAAPRLGMTPSAWARGGARVTIRWTVAATSLGPLLIAATDTGLCRIAFDEDAATLATRFPQATIAPADARLAALAAAVVAEVEGAAPDPALPLDVRGTAFQEAVWQALRTIPAGETRSYAQLAAAAGRPEASRAAGSACGANPLAVIVPCHRVTRADGSPGGYAWGTDRKRALLDRERG